MKESQGVRLTRKERSYFEEYWNGEFSPWVHSKIKEDLEKINGNIWKNKYQNYTYSMVMMAIGAMFWFFILSITNLAVAIILFLIGLFLIVNGGITLLLERKKHDRRVHG